MAMSIGTASVEVENPVSQSPYSMSVQRSSQASPRPSLSVSVWAGFLLSTVVTVVRDRVTVIVESRLARVGDRGAVVGGPADAVTIRIVQGVIRAHVAEITEDIPVDVLLSRVGDVGAVVEVVIDAIAVPVEFDGEAFRLIGTQVPVVPLVGRRGRSEAGGDVGEPGPGMAVDAPGTHGESHPLVVCRVVPFGRVAQLVIETGAVVERDEIDPQHPGVLLGHGAAAVHRMAVDAGAELVDCHGVDAGVRDDVQAVEIVAVGIPEVGRVQIVTAETEGELFVAEGFVRIFDAVARIKAPLQIRFIGVADIQAEVL